MQLLKIGDVLINPEHIIAVQFRPDVRDYDKPIGEEPDPAPLRPVGSTRTVYERRNAVRIIAEDREFVFLDAEAEAVRAWFGVGREGFDVVDITSKAEATPKPSKPLGSIGYLIASMPAESKEIHRQLWSDTPDARTGGGGTDAPGAGADTGGDWIDADALAHLSEPGESIEQTWRRLRESAEADEAPKPVTFREFT